MVLSIAIPVVGEFVVVTVLGMLVDAADAGRVTGVVVFDVAVERVVEVVNSGVLAVVGDSTSSPEPTSPEPTSPSTIAKIFEVVFDRVASGVVDTLGILGIVEGVDGMLDAVLPEVLEVVCVDAVNKKLFVR